MPVVREISASSPSVSTWNAFVPVLEQNGCTYTSLAQVAALMDGTLKWHPVSHSVELSLHGHTAYFTEASRQALLDGRPRTLTSAPIKNDQGFWVPVGFFASHMFFRHTKIRLVWPPAPPQPKVLAKPIVVTQKIAEPVQAPQAPTPFVAIPASPSPVRPFPVVPEAVVPGLVEKLATLPVETVREQAVPQHSARAIHRIVIDPGHGGKDPGTQGAHGMEEKTLNLLIAQNLADALRAEDYEVLLTRTDDTFIPLEERTRLANKYNADLFVSIHCNASLSSKLKGFEVYFLSESASDPHADAVARMENAPLALEGKAIPIQNQVQAVLRSLVKTAYINESSELGALIDRHVGERLSEPRLGVKQANFCVLRGAEMPAILIETGFLTNAKEEHLLQDTNFQKKLVDGIVKGLAAYDERKQKERHG